MKVSDEQYKKKENAMFHHTRVDTLSNPWL